MVLSNKLIAECDALKSYIDTLPDFHPQPKPQPKPQELTRHKTNINTYKKIKKQKLKPNKIMSRKYCKIVSFLVRWISISLVASFFLNLLYFSASSYTNEEVTILSTFHEMLIPSIVCALFVLGIVAIDDEKEFSPRSIKK
jgi:hypothetical protein